MAASSVNLSRKTPAAHGANSTLSRDRRVAAAASQVVAPSLGHRGNRAATVARATGTAAVNRAAVGTTKPISVAPARGQPARKAAAAAKAVVELLQESNTAEEAALVNNPPQIMVSDLCFLIFVVKSDEILAD